MPRQPNLDRFSDPEVLRKLLSAALEARDKARMTAAHHAEAVRQAVTLAIANLEIPAVPKPPKDTRSHGEEIANPVIADWQLGKDTKTYNPKVCEQRIERFAERVIKLTKIQRADHPVKKCVVFDLGDIVEGELIFPGQAHVTKASLYQQVVVDAPRIKVNLARALLTEFDFVDWYVVPGNHGRMGGRQHRDYHPETNADRMVAGFVRELMKDEPRIRFHLAEGVLEGGWDIVPDIGGYRTLLFHGDQIQGGLTTENHLKKLILGWRADAIDGGFDDAFLGHFHVVKKFTFNRTTVRVCGSPESDNAYAVRALGSKSRPSQHLQFIKPGKGVTAEYTIFLDGSW